MAGSYPDAPGPRMAYDLDGSAAVDIALSGTVNPLSAASMQVLNNEASDYYTPLDGVAILFPQARDIAGVLAATRYESGVIQVSTDTTTGIDGTWSTIGTATSSSYAEQYRPVTVVAAVSSVLGVRVMSGTRIYRIHIYGSPSATSDRLAMWHPTLDEPVSGAYFDWGDVSQNTSGTRTFRVKNLSATLTASTITLSTSTLTDSTPSILPQHTLATDGVTFGATATIASLAPGAISAPVTLQRLSPANAQLGLWALRMQATAASWA